MRFLPVRRGLRAVFYTIVFWGCLPRYPPDFARGKPKRYALLCAAARFTGRPQPVIYLAPESVPPERTVSHMAQSDFNRALTAAFKALEPYCSSAG